MIHIDKEDLDDPQIEEQFSSLIMHIKKSIPRSAYCLILIRDAEETSYLKKNKFDKFPSSFTPLKSVHEKIDSCIQLQSL